MQQHQSKTSCISIAIIEPTSQTFLGPFPILVLNVQSSPAPFSCSLSSFFSAPRPLTISISTLCTYLLTYLYLMAACFFADLLSSLVCHWSLSVNVTCISILSGLASVYLLPNKTSNSSSLVTSSSLARPNV